MLVAEPLRLRRNGKPFRYHGLPTRPLGLLVLAIGMLESAREAPLLTVSREGREVVQIQHNHYR